MQLKIGDHLKLLSTKEKHHKIFGSCARKFWPTKPNTPAPIPLFPVPFPLTELQQLQGRGGRKLNKMKHTKHKQRNLEQKSQIHG